MSTYGLLIQKQKGHKKLMMPSSFSPFINTTPDGKEVWVDHKDVGEITRISTKDNEIIETFKTGKISNHFAFANNKAYVTVGGENSVNIYDYGEKHAKLIKKYKQKHFLMVSGLTPREVKFIL